MKRAASGVVVDQIPAELRELAQWVCWREEDRDGKPTKVPYTPDGHAASTTDARTWSTFEAAVGAVDRFDGIGFVFTVNDPYCGVDIDNCIDMFTGLNDDAAAVVASLNSYTEESPSWLGVHVIVRAKLEGAGRRRVGNVEMYDRGRYFTVTGRRLEGLPTSIEERQTKLDAYREVLFGPARDASRAPSQPVDLDDRELLELAFAARNGAELRALYAGDTSRYGSHSEADLALCAHLAFWTRRDVARIDSLFRASGLYREKWDRDDYREWTIAKAINGTTEVYTPSRARDNGSTAEHAGEPSPADDVPPDEPRLLRTLRGDEIEMRSIEWLDKPLLQGSAFHLAAGPKGVGKGTWLARKIADTTKGRLGPKRNVLIVSSEDSASIDLKPRLVAARADHTRWHLVVEELVLPRDLYRIEDLAARLGDIGLIVLDPVGNHLGGVDTDKEGLVRFAISGLNKLADDLACIVVGVRHLAKMRIHGALAAVLGSTAWVDVPRAVLAFARDDEDDMLFHVQVVAGNRSGRTAARAYRLELRDVGLKEKITCAVAIGESNKSVDDLLAAPRKTSKSENARELILDILETDGEQESDTLDARVARETGLTAKTVRNLRGGLVAAGLIRSVPESDKPGGAVDRWKVVRTSAPRPDNEVPDS
jgi:AAA domain